MGVRELIVMSIMCLVWGMHFIVVKLAVAEVPPIFYAAMRMTLVASILAVFLRWRPGMMVPVISAAACLGMVNYALMFTGLSYSTASISAIALELYVPFATILSVIFFQEKIGLPRIFGISISFVGVIIIVSGASHMPVGDSVLIGVILVVLASFVEALGAINVKRAVGFKPHELLAWFALVGTIGLWPLSFILETGQQEALAQANHKLLFGAIIYSAVGGSLIGHMSYYWLLQRLPLSQVAPSTMLATLVAVIAGVVLLNEPFGLRLVIGALMTLAGVGIVLVRTHSNQSTTSGEDTQKMAFKDRP